MIILACKNFTTCYSDNTNRVMKTNLFDNYTLFFYIPRYIILIIPGSNNDKPKMGLKWQEVTINGPDVTNWLIVDSWLALMPGK